MAFSIHCSFTQNAMQQEVAEQEEQLAITREQYHTLQYQLQDMLATIAKEAGQISKLETELREGKGERAGQISRL